MTLTNRFPSEFLQKVSIHLSLQDCWNSTLVCRSWHHAFQRALYKKVYIYSDSQLEQLILSLSNHGYLVKELHLVSTTSHETTAYIEDETVKTHIQLDQDTLSVLNKLCPLLEVIDFDLSQWNHFQLNKASIQWKQMRSCGTVRYADFNPSFLSVFGSNLTRLHMTHYPQDLEGLVENLRDLPTLKDLTLEILFDDHDDGNMMIPSSRHLEKMHGYLPRLEKFNFMRSKTPHHEAPAFSHDVLVPFSQPTSVLSLTLHGHVDSIQWFKFIARNYPNLQELKLSQITTSRFGTKWIWQTALVELIRSLPSLQLLSLGGKNIPQLFSKSLLIELKTCSIENLNVDFQTYQAIESCQFLLSLASHGLRQLRHLSLRVWEQIPGWSGVTKNLFKCHGLISLHLSFSKGFMDQFPFTPFLIDRFLENLPQLKVLSLTGANVQVMYQHFKDLDLNEFALEELSLTQCKVENHETVFQYMSTCCPKLNQVMFRKCESERKLINKSSLLNEWIIDLQHNRLKKVILSSILIYIGTIQSNDFIGIEINDEYGKQMIWCCAIKSMIYPEYIICDDQEKNTELDNVYRSYKSSQPLDIMPGNYAPVIGVLVIYCKSVAQVFLDNLKIPK